MRRYRRGLMMEKPASAKCRIHIWCISLACFLLWMFLLHLFSSSAIVAHTSEALFGEDNYTASIRMSDSRNVTLTDISDQGNENLPASNHTVDQAEDVEVINDLVKELENEKEAKDSGLDADLASRNDKRLKDAGSNKVSASTENGRELPKARSSERVVATKDTKKPEDKHTAAQNEENDESTHEEIVPKKEGSADRHKAQFDERRRTSRGGGLRKQPFEMLKLVERRTENVQSKPRERTILRPPRGDSDPCSGKYVYVHDIPSLFNEELLRNCRSLSPWTDMCEATANLGLGSKVPDIERVSGWFATNQFTLEVIFHNRMKQYECLTKNSTKASAIFVPYYGGLDVMRFLWGPFPNLKDAAALDLMKWLRETLEWKRMSGRDHFMVAGRTTWDFMRTPENESDWGNRLMILPETRNMTMLLIEASPWNSHGFGIPYPTYFHPSSDDEVTQWQARLRRTRRRYLYSFVGAPRPHLGESIRGEIIDQCKASRRRCRFLECVAGSQKCYRPDEIMKLFLSSTFCLQPTGDSFTRRSVFDSIIAGCIPVFFHPGTAYVQYIWHLPGDYTKYSVFMPENAVKRGRVSIERALQRVPKSKVVAMREEVIRMIPRVIYADPRGRLERYEDAFDLAVKRVIKRVEGRRGGRKEDFPEKFSWKYNLVGNVEEHEWDPYFDRH